MTSVRITKSQYQPALEPDWLGFIQPFTQPAFEGSPYDIIQTKVQEAWIEADTTEAKHNAMSLHQHWNNVSAGLLSAEVRSSAWLAINWSTLLERLELCGKALEPEQITLVETLFKEFNLI